MRKYDLKSLGKLQRNVSDELHTARALRAVLDSSLRELDSAESQLKYTQAHINQRKAELRREALGRVRAVNANLATWTAQAAKERVLWSRKALLLDQYSDSDAGDRSTRALEQATAAIRRLELSNRLSRLNDHQFEDFLQSAVDMQDGQSIILASEEAAIRGGLAAVSAKQAVDSLACPQADAADQIYDRLSADLQEATALEKHIENPDDQLSYARIRSAEISRQTAETAPGDEKTKGEGKPMDPTESGYNLDFTDAISPKPAA